jgi:hypothetical protein
MRAQDALKILVIDEVQTADVQRREMNGLTHARPATSCVSFAMLISKSRLCSAPLRTSGLYDANAEPVRYVRASCWSVGDQGSIRCTVSAVSLVDKSLMRFDQELD